MRFTPAQLAELPPYDPSRGKDYRPERRYPDEESLGTGLRPSEVMYHVMRLSESDKTILPTFRQWVANCGAAIFEDMDTAACLVALSAERARRFEEAIRSGTDKDQARLQIRADVYAQLLQAFKD